MGLTTGGQTMIDYAKRFGFGKATGIELAGEGSGILFDADDMSEVDEATMLSARVSPSRRCRWCRLSEPSPTAAI